MTRSIMAGLAMVLVAALVLPAGCRPSASGPTTSPGGPDSAQAQRWLDMLKVLPLNEGKIGETSPAENVLRSAYVQDLARLAEKQKQYPQITDNYSLLQNMPMWNLRYYTDTEWRETLGFTRSDVDQEIWAYRTVPMDSYQALSGRFDRGRIETAAKTGPGHELMQTAMYAGQQYYGWGDMSMSLRSNVRPIGYGMRLALVDDFVFWTTWDDGMKEMIDACQGKAKSLADLESYQLLAGGLARLDTFTAFFSSESQAQSHIKEVFKDIIADPGEGEGARTRRVMAELIQREVLLQPYQALATGAGVDDKGYYMAVVLLNADEATARGNAAVLEKQVSDVTTPDGSLADLVQQFEVTSEGRLTLAKLYGPVSAHWKSFDMTTGAYIPLLMYRG